MRTGRGAGVKGGVPLALYQTIDHLTLDAACISSSRRDCARRARGGTRPSILSALMDVSKAVVVARRCWVAAFQARWRAGRGRLRWWVMRVQTGTG